MGRDVREKNWIVFTVREADQESKLKKKRFKKPATHCSLKKLQEIELCLSNGKGCKGKGLDCKRGRPGVKN